MNLLPKQSLLETQSASKVTPESTPAIGDSISGLDFSFLTDDVKKTMDRLNGDDCMVDITNDDLCLTLTEKNKVNTEVKEKQENVPEKLINNSKVDIKPMTDINIKLESIKPSTIPPLMVLEEKNGISVTLHFAKDKPRDDVQVIVVTTISKNTLPLCNYLFQGVVPKVRHLNLI